MLSAQLRLLIYTPIDSIYQQFLVIINDPNKDTGTYSMAISMA